MTNLRRFKSLSRKIGTKDPKPKIVIYCEGRRTEPDYFNAMKRFFRSVVMDIEIIEAAGVPMTIARTASEAAQAAKKRNRRQSYEDRDEFWAVFDCDDHPKVKQAITCCQRANVGVAYSNPCFELWLILHFEDYDRPDDRRAVQRKLNELCPDYDLHRDKTTDCSALMKHISRAETLAERQFCRRGEEGEPLRRPFTTVYKLTRRIRCPTATGTKA